MRGIVSSLSNLYVFNDIDSFMRFIERANGFVNYTITNEIFVRLDSFTMLKNRYIQRTGFIENVERISMILYKVLGITLDVTSTFIPSLLVPKCLYDVLSAVLSEYDIIRIRNREYNISGISLILGKLQIESANISRMFLTGDTANIDIKKIEKCLNNNTSHSFLQRRLEEIEEVCANMIILVGSIPNQINNYYNLSKENGFDCFIRSVTQVFAG